MSMSLLDWSVVVLYFLLTLGVGLAFRKRAGRSLADYFVSGRSFPWWLAGTSMVATTFAADTPLAVTSLVSKHGLAGNWFWWAFAMGGMFTVFIYARLWRRTGVITDVELIELRYGGKAAAFLRGFRSVYIAFLVNSIIIGWVTGAMLTVLNVLVFAPTTSDTNQAAAVAPAGEITGELTPVSNTEAVTANFSGRDTVVIIGLLAVVGLYSTISGLWGVAVTDVMQFLLAMGGCIALAVISLRDIGGVEVLRAMVVEKFAGGEQAFSYLPTWSGDHAWMTIDIFLLMLFVQWWATWYPGAEPGGGGYIVQRMASAKDERNSVLATLWFQVAHYCIRPWPWLIIAFVAIAKYDLTSLDDPGQGFAFVIRDFAPNGLRGLMLVAFLAAFMSTISTQLNWGASYLVNDFYKRFISPDADEQQLMRMSRLASVAVLVAGAIAAFLMKGVSVDEAWKFLAALGAGTGAVFMLRWFWWRINSWSEISAMVASLVAFSVVQGIVSKHPDSWLATAEYQMAFVALLTIPTWLVVTLLTPPEQDAKLCSFYRLARPGGPGWRRIAVLAPDVKADTDLRLCIVASLVASLMIYLTIPGIGALILGPSSRAVACLSGASLCAIVVANLLPRILKSTETS